MKQQQNLSGTDRQALWLALGGLGLIALATTAYRQATRFRFAGKVVVITGGSRGLGLEMGRKLARQGARLAIVARTGDQLAAAKDELDTISSPVMAIQADVTSEAEARLVIAQVVEKFGGLDVLINNAGTMLVSPENVLETTDYQRVMDANLWSAVYMVNAAMPHFRAAGEGRIANICSIGGKIAVPHMLPYSVSKFALTGYSEGLATELEKENIKVTTVVPNLMRTGSPRNISVKGDHEAEYAWFKLSDSLPGLSQRSDKAAGEIIEAIALGKREIILTPIARFATGLQGVAPGTVTTISQWVNRLLPAGNNPEIRKGYESESETTTGVIGGLTDEAAEKNNEEGSVY